MMLYALLAISWAAFAAAGFAVCSATHRQRGLEVDAPAVVIPSVDPELVS